MELNRAVCTTCGANVNVDMHQKKGTCEACGNTYLVSHAVDLQKVEIDKTKDLKNYRILLKQAIENSDYDTMRTQAKGILEILPEDFKAQYFFAFASKKNHSPKALERFYKGRHYEATEESINEVLNHIIEYSDLSDYALIKGFITYINPAKLERYEEQFIVRRRLEDNYSVIPRDAFICHRSRDRREAEAVVNVLEKDGYQGWISYRNLRPNDNENYWNNIEAAIENCKIFLVVTSNDAMLSKDVQRELEIADKLGKPKLEFKIDDSEHTSLFKHFFDGHKWIDASVDITGAFNELKDRFYQLMDSIKHQKQSNKEEKGEVSKLDNFIKRAQLSLSHQDYRQASESVESALDLDVESPEAWYIKFLADHKFKSTKQFHDFVHESDDLESILDVIQSKAFQTARKFSDDSKSFQDIVQTIEARIDEYVDNVKIDDYDVRRILNAIIEYQPNNDTARFKLFLFSQGIPSIKRFKHRLTDKTMLISTEAMIESDKFQRMMESITTEEIKNYVTIFERFKEDLGGKAIVSMRKTQKKRQDLVEKIKQLMQIKQFKKAYKPINKLHKLGPEFKSEALFYSLLSDHEIKDSEHLKAFLKNNENHYKIKAMMRNKKYKMLKKDPIFETFVQNMEAAHAQTLKGMKVNKIRDKIHKVKTRYRKWYSFNHFLIGLTILALGLIYYSTFMENELFGFSLLVDETYFIIESLAIITFLIMLITLVLREIAFFKIALLSRKLDNKQGLEKTEASLWFMVIPLLLFVGLATYASDHFIDGRPNLTRNLYLIFTDDEIPYILLIIMFATLIVYSVLQRRSEKLNTLIKVSRSFRRVLLRPFMLVVVVVLINYYLYIM